jgi:exodeoxyribonuclease III
MRIISLNVNGIRSATRKGFFDWLKYQKADVICLQETKAQKKQLDASHFPEEYQAYFFDAEKKGYSGVAIYSRVKPDSTAAGLGWECADKEGRYLQLNFPGLSIASLYMPSGSSSELRQEFKFQFLNQYLPILKKQFQHKQDFIICGDWNIAHKFWFFTGRTSLVRSSVGACWLCGCFSSIESTDRTIYLVVKSRACLG